MNITIRLQAGDYGHGVAELDMTEEDLKRDHPVLHAVMEKEWRWVAPLESDDLLGEGDDEMDWLGATQCDDLCQVEPDGRCPHGFYSRGIRLGLI